MLPTTGQGGTQSLEDIAALSILLHSNALQNGSETEISERLRIYEGLRKERMGVVQGTSGLTFGDEARVATSKGRLGQVMRSAGIGSAEEHTRFLYQ